MDPVSVVAASIVAFLSPYLAAAGQEFAKEVGKTAGGKIGALYETLKTRLKKNPSAKEALSDLEAEPGNQDIQASLRRQLVKEMKADQGLSDTLQKLVDEINNDQASKTFLTQVYGGEVGQIINANHIGSISYTPSPKPRKAPKSK